SLLLHLVISQKTMLFFDCDCQKPPSSQPKINIRNPRQFFSIPSLSVYTHLPVARASFPSLFDSIPMDFLDALYFALPVARQSPSSLLLTLSNGAYRLSY